MSGFELVGVAASIFQIAELGAQLSIKLCTFCHKVKNADQNIQSLSNDVALTSTVLRHLGDNLEQDRQGELYSNGALNTAREVLEECRKVFQQIGSAIDDPGKDSAKGLFQRAAKRVGFVIMEPQLDALKSNLERLKSTMLLMLNVIMYAGQIRGRLESNVLREQRELIQKLVEEKRINDQRFRQLTNALESSSLSDDETLTDEREVPMSSASVNSASSAENFRHKELSVYCDLIAKMLSDIDACKSDLDSARHFRINNSVFGMNTMELRYFEFTHGRMASDFIRTRVPQLYDRADPPLPGETWGRVLDRQGYNGDDQFRYRQRHGPYPVADIRHGGSYHWEAPASSEPVILNPVEPRQHRIVEIRRDYDPESSRLATETQTTHSFDDQEPSPRPSLVKSRRKKKKGSSAKPHRSRSAPNKPSTEQRDPSRYIVGRDDYGEQNSKASYNARSPSPVLNGRVIYLDRCGRAYTHVMDFDAEPEFDEPDEKDQVSSVDSLLFEWTTLAKEEVSSSASLVVTP